MANPFLVLGGIAISVATAAFGILQVPGWVASAQDAAATNDVSQVAQAQAISLAKTGRFAPSVTALSDGSMKVSSSAHTLIRTTVDSTRKHHVTVAKSASGTFFARLSKNATVGRGANIEAAISAAGTTISGPATARVTAEGVPVPGAFVDGEVVARNYVLNPLATSVDEFTVDGNATLSSVTDFPGATTTALRSTRTSTHNVRWVGVVLDNSIELGEQYRVTFQARSSHAMTARVSVRESILTYPPVASAEQYVSVAAGVNTFDLTFNTTAAPIDVPQFVFASDTGPVGATVDFTRISVTKVSAGVGFFHGGSGTVSGASAGWSGTPNASMSELVRSAAAG